MGKILFPYSNNKEKQTTETRVTEGACNMGNRNCNLDGEMCFL